MSTNSSFNFRVDKSKKTVYVTKEFAAGLSLVWDAFTKKELLDQWWAPKPFLSKTKVMEFKVGGRRFYAMVSPEGKQMWQLQQYTSITPKTNFKFLSVFADEDQTPHLPGSDWDLSFTEENGRTKVDISIYNESLERMERMMEMGFKEGFTATLNELDSILTSLK
jgi:uncharacterized protein YndB with AHSA1/START domain